MKLFYYIKTTLKSMIANGSVTILYFILFPIVLATFMGFVQNTNNDNPLKLKPVDAQIIDKDNSDVSKGLIELLNSKEMKDIVNTVETKPEVEIIIDKGYENNILSLNKGSITINKKVEEKGLVTNTLKSILDKYHQNLYVELSGKDKESLNKIIDESIIESIIIDTPKESNSYEKMAASMIGFVIIMQAYTLIQSGYADVSINLGKRIGATPISEIEYFFIEYVASLVYVFIILSIYVMFFRMLRISFLGNFAHLIILILVGTILSASISKCISTLFGAKYGKIVGTLIFMLPIIGGELFGIKANKAGIVAPTHYLNNAFSLYNLNGNLQGCGKWLAVTLIGSIIMILIAIVKIIFHGRKKRCS
ncbi:ABC transporter permease [Clostridium sp. CTA-19]